MKVGGLNEMNQTIKWQTCDRYGRHVSSDNQMGEYTYIT